MKTYFIQPNSDGFYSNSPKIKVPLERENFILWLASLDLAREFICFNPYQSALARYFQAITGFSSWWVDITGWYSEWERYGGSKDMPKWAVDFILGTSKSDHMSVQETIDFLNK